jgi:LPXTG-site transpeptidase (sortase) family protein
MQLKNSFEELYHQIKARRVAFFIVFFIAVLLSYGVLFAIDFIPEPISEETKQAQLKEAEEKAKKREIMVTEEKVSLEAATASEVAEGTVEVKKEVAVSVETELPTRIIIDTLDVDVKVLNPQTRDIAALDTALLSGVVRHPDSATFGKAGNMLIMGHSSYLPNVMNKNFQAFNGIQKMTWGDKIRVQSEGKEYIYRVQKVYQAKASEITVPFTPGKAMLTLATCNSFGSKEDRFIVEANLIEEKAL